MAFIKNNNIVINNEDINIFIDSVSSNFKDGDYYLCIYNSDKEKIFTEKLIKDKGRLYFHKYIKDFIVDNGEYFYNIECLTTEFNKINLFEENQVFNVRR